MPPPRPRVLLVQARTTFDIELQEQECFLERCRIDVAQLRSVNVVRDRIHPGLLDGVDALMIGGAGEFSAAEDYSWTEDVLRLVRHVVDRALPTFGSCWGHQVIARAMGGEVRHDAALAEMGCHEVELTEAGLRDRLFEDFPPRFRVNMGHHDRVTRLPEGAVDLARSATQPHQAFRLGDLPIYGTQFHSELDARRERERLFRYRELYPEVGDQDSFQRILDGLADTTEVDHLLHDFLTKFVGLPGSC